MSEFHSRYREFNIIASNYDIDDSGARITTFPAGLYVVQTLVFLMLSFQFQTSALHILVKNTKTGILIMTNL